MKALKEEQKREEQLRESKEIFKNIYAESPIGIELYDSNGQFFHANKACLDMFGVSDVAEVKGLKLFEDPNVTDEVKGRLRKGETVRYETSFDFEKVKEHKLYKTTKSGIIYLDVLMTPLGLKEKETVSYLIHVQDITERKLVERMLRDSEERFRIITGSALDAIMMINDEGKISFWNEAAEKMFGYSSEYVSGKEMDTLIMPERYKQSYRSGLTTFKATGQAVVISKTVELTAVRRDGTEFPIAISLTAVTLEGRRYAIAIARDITERKQATEALQESEKKYRSLFESMLNAFAYCKILVDEDNRPIDFVHLQVNDAWERSIGLKREDIIGKKVTEVIPGIRESKTDLIGTYGKVALTGKVTKFDLYFEPLGKWFNISVYSPQKGYFVTVFEDITERKRSEEKIKHLNQLLRATYNISQLSAKEKDRESLLKCTCEALIEPRGYYYAWITLLDESGNIVATAEAGLGKDFLLILNQWKRGRLPAYAQRALRQPEVVLIRETAPSCTDCPLASKGATDGGRKLTVRLEHDGKVYGLLSCCITSHCAFEEEELSLFQRVAGDIAFALHSIELEKQRRRAVDSLVELTRYL